jgi:hypothetical protein
MYYEGQALDLQEEYREERAERRGLRQRAEQRAENYEPERRFFVADVTNGGEYDGDVLGEVYEGPLTRAEADARAAELNAQPHAADLRYGVVEDEVRADEEQWRERCSFVAPRPALPVADDGEPQPVTPRRRRRAA